MGFTVHHKIGPVLLEDFQGKEVGEFDCGLMSQAGTKRISKIR